MTDPQNPATADAQVEPSLVAASHDLAALAAEQHAGDEPELQVNHPTDPRERFRVELLAQLPPASVMSRWISISGSDPSAGDVFLAAEAGEPIDESLLEERWAIAEAPAGYTPEAVTDWALEYLDDVVRDIAIVVGGRDDVEAVLTAKAEGDEAMAELGTASGLIAGYLENARYLDRLAGILGRGVSLKESSELKRTVAAERDRLVGEVRALQVAYPALANAAETETVAKTLVIP